MSVVRAGVTENPYKSSVMAMYVPDRIIVRGQDKHVGAKALPRELQLETATAAPPDPITVKMHTPPRSITLGGSIPCSRNSSSRATSEGEDETLLIDDNYVAHISSRYFSKQTPSSPGRDHLNFWLNDSVGSMRCTDTDSGMATDEVQHLREQLCRINRRVLCLEEEVADRKDRERYFLAAGAIYASVQALSWLFRSSTSR